MHGGGLNQSEVCAMTPTSKAKQLIGYSFLVIFANDDTISEEELHMLEKLALEDHVIDDEEREVLASIFKRANHEKMAEQLLQEIDSFKKEYEIP